MTRTNLLASAFAVALTGGAGAAFAHHPGGPGNASGAGPINTISATTLPQGMSVVSVSYEYIGLDPLSDARLAHEAEHAHEHGHGHAHVHSLGSISSPALNYAYGVTGNLTLSLKLPYVERNDIRMGHFHEHDGEGEVIVHGDAGGIGDLSAMAQWRVLNNQASGFEAALLAGVKAPTGSTDEDDREGASFDAEFQPGSGSWDGMVGFAATQRVGRWSFDASALYMVVGEGIQDTDLGDRFHYGVAASYRLLTSGGAGAMFHGAKRAHAPGEDGHGGHNEGSGGPSLDLVLELNGEWHDKQETAGEEDGNSGGHTLHVSPGVRLAMDKWSAFASVGIPVANELNGIQAEPEWRLTSGVSVGF